MKYAVIDQTGKILRTGICPAETFNLQAGKDEIVLDITDVGPISDITKKVVDGKIVDKTVEEIEAAKPPKPVDAADAKVKSLETALSDALTRINQLEGKVVTIEGKVTTIEKGIK